MGELVAVVTIVAAIKIWWDGRERWKQYGGWKLTLPLDLALAWLLAYPTLTHFSSEGLPPYDRPGDNLAWVFGLAVPIALFMKWHNAAIEGHRDPDGRLRTVAERKALQRLERDARRFEWVDDVLPTFMEKGHVHGLSLEKAKDLIAYLKVNHGIDALLGRNMADVQTGRTDDCSVYRGERVSEEELRGETSQSA